MAKRDLILDCDGVIIDSITFIYKMLEENGIKPGEYEKVYAFLEKYKKWEQLIKDVGHINDSIYHINRIIESKKFREVSVATHVINMEEAKAKVEYLRAEIPNLSRIHIIHKRLPKTAFFSIDLIRNSVFVDDYDGNLDEWADAGGYPVKFSTKEGKISSYPVINNLGLLIDLEKAGAFGNHQSQKVKSLTVNKLGYYND